MLNLVCQLVRDAFLNAFDVSVIVTNDADPIEPIVRGETGKTVGLLSPVIQQQRLAAYPSPCGRNFVHSTFVVKVDGAEGERAHSRREPPDDHQGSLGLGVKTRLILAEF